MVNLSAMVKLLAMLGVKAMALPVMLGVKVRGKLVLVKVRALRECCQWTIELKLHLIIAGLVDRSSDRTPISSSSNRFPPNFLDSSKSAVFPLSLLRARFPKHVQTDRKKCRCQNFE